MKIYILSPVRNVTPEQQNIIDNHVSRLELDSHDVYVPRYDVDQEDPTGFDICSSHFCNMLKADRVDIFWDISSSGSHFDLGMAFACGKIVKLISAFSDDVEGKSYIKVIKEMESLQSSSKYYKNFISF